MKQGIDLNTLPQPINDTVKYLADRLGGSRPGIMIKLGSGLGEVLSGLTKVVEIPYGDIPGIRSSTVSGHKGVLEILEHKGKHVAVFRGRLHTYEGYSPDDVVRSIRALALLGTHTAIITNAAGSTSKKLAPGDLVLLKDHINMNAQTPLISEEARSLGETFIDLSDGYSRELRKKILKAAKTSSIKLSEGVYAWMKGPQFETAAEVRMLNKLGADVVGMSTVPEVIALRQLDVKVVGISMVSNYGTGVSSSKLSHHEVKATGQKVSAKLDKLLKIIIGLV